MHLIRSSSGVNGIPGMHRPTTPVFSWVFFQIFFWHIHYIHLRVKTDSWLTNAVTEVKTPVSEPDYARTTCIITFLRMIQLILLFLLTIQVNKVCEECICGSVTFMNSACESNLLHAVYSRWLTAVSHTRDIFMQLPICRLWAQHLSE